MNTTYLRYLIPSPVDARLKYFPGGRTFPPAYAVDIVTGGFWRRVHFQSAREAVGHYFKVRKEGAD